MDKKETHQQKLQEQDGFFMFFFLPATDGLNAKQTYRSHNILPLQLIFMLKSNYVNLILSSKLQLSGFILSTSSQYLQNVPDSCDGESGYFLVGSSCAICPLSKTYCTCLFAGSCVEPQSVTHTATNIACELCVPNLVPVLSQKQTQKQIKYLNHTKLR